ncbi:hypothetical protein FM125_01230 [Micrococcus lylae]|uniref:Uncharacterized protein n=1 Tax=Micrococcus lylae TaxID=1273 RepID=A0A1R4IAZ8_9MICC|nr:hypothetical protein FM125_01230 [Micrococcus lylae]
MRAQADGRGPGACSASFVCPRANRSALGGGACSDASPGPSLVP